MIHRRKLLDSFLKTIQVFKTNLENLTLKKSKLNILQKFNNTFSCTYTDILVHDQNMTDTYPWHLHLTVGQGPSDAVVVDPLPPSVLLLPEILRADTDQGAGIGHFRLDTTSFVKVDVRHHLLVLDHLSHHVQLSGWVGFICRVCHYYITVMLCVRVH